MTGKKTGMGEAVVSFVIQARLFFLKLAADSAREVNRMVDLSGISHERKAMIQTGLCLDKNGLW